jgi:hypothetical protein
MVSARKLMANRLNALKGGPRSAAGKKRAAGNSRTHGLFSQCDRATSLKGVEALASELAVGRTHTIILELARSAAEAEVDLRRVRRAKLALIDRVSEFGSLELPQFFATGMRETKWLISMEKWMDRGSRGRRPNQPMPEDFLSSMPSNKHDRALEAIKRVMPELVKLGRYEKRAAGRRNRAIRQIAGLMSQPAASGTS